MLFGNTIFAQPTPPPSISPLLLKKTAKAFGSRQNLVPTLGLIPQPTEIVIANNNPDFLLQFSTTFSIKGFSPTETQSLRQQIKQNIGIENENPETAQILIEKVSELESLHEGNPIAGQLSEAYRLKISGKPAQIQIKAITEAGVFYALQTLRQLLPPEVCNAPEKMFEKQETTYYLTALTIADAPRFAYRGMHLDVCRHFFSVEFVKKYIDLMAMHKFNTFHWHLTEDQVWRIEIKKYPKLTEIGAFRDETLVGHYSQKPHQFDKTPHGGFYTQAQIKEVVAYAMARHITIIPEIELPGHSLAALAAYPELSCDPSKTYKTGTKWGVFEDVYCPTEKTFEFLEDVLTEVMELFPSKYIHIGGDECPKEAWKKSSFCQALIKKEGLKDEHELQSYFVRRIEKFLNQHNRAMIGWDEILEGGLAPNATVMSWRGERGGIEAAQQNHDVIMTPSSHCYFDHYQAEPTNEPTAIGGFTNLEKVYNYEPIPAVLTEEQAKHVLGTRGNVWTEYILNENQVEYMVFPRACALAEVLWSKKGKNYNLFLQRLTKHLSRLDAHKVNYATRAFDVVVERKENMVAISSPVEKILENSEIYFSLDQSEPTPNSIRYQKEIKLTEKETNVNARIFQGERALGGVISRKYFLHKALGKKYLLTHQPQKTHDAGNEGLTDGQLGSEKSNALWTAFKENDLEMVVDLEKKISLKRIAIQFLHNPNAAVLMPRTVTLMASNDGKNWEMLKSFSLWKLREDKTIIKLDYAITTGKNAFRYVKIMAKNVATCPEGLAQTGKPAWIFVDEVVIE
jgi:hexosaminidase